MRTLVVFGRGGPRSPAKRPQYLSQPPPILKYGLGTLLKGNRFQMLASVYENDEFYSTDNLESNLNTHFDHKSVVHQTKIPNSSDDVPLSNCSDIASLPAPKNDMPQTQQSGNTYTEIVRGRSKSNFFHKKTKSSKRFTQLLKESFHKKSPTKSTSETPLSSMATLSNAGSQIHPETNIQGPQVTDDANFEMGSVEEEEIETVEAMTQDVEMLHEKEPDTADDEFNITKDEATALINHEITSTKPSQSSLQLSLTSNTVQPDITRFFSSNKSTNIPSVPPVQQSNATNVGTFTTTAPTVVTPNKKAKTSLPPTIADQEEETVKIPVRTDSKQEITCRFKIRIEGGTCNLPLLVKQVVKLYRGVDPSLTVLPIRSDCDDSFILDNEESIPENETDLKQWVTTFL